MASICALLDKGLDFSCLTDVARKYYQEMVIINTSDIDSTTVVKTIASTPTTCDHKVAFTLKATKTGYKLALPDTGGSISGMFDKTTNELTGGPQYLHKVNYAVIGISEDVKCFLRTLDKGSFIVALRAKGSNVVEVYGIDNGLSNADYTYDIAGGSGGSAIVLQSLETAPENNIPFVYDSVDPVADFDLLFAN